MIIPARKNFTIYQGSTFRHIFRWTSGDTTFDQVQFDINDVLFRIQARPNIKSDIILFELTSENGGIIKYTPEDGIFVIYMDHIQTATLDFSRAVYDMEVILPWGDVYKIFEGSFILKREVTR